MVLICCSRAWTRSGTSSTSIWLELAGRLARTAFWILDSSCFSPSDASVWHMLEGAYHPQGSAAAQRSGKVVCEVWVLHRAIVAGVATGLALVSLASLGPLCLEIMTSPCPIDSSEAGGSSVAWMSHIAPLLSIEASGCKGRASQSICCRALVKLPRSVPKGNGPARNCCLGPAGRYTASGLTALDRSLA